MVLYEKFIIIIILVFATCDLFYFSLWLLSIFFSLISFSFNMICLGSFFWWFILLGFLWSSSICGLVSVINFLKFSVVITLNVAFTLLSYPSGTPMACTFWYCPIVLDVLFCFIFFLFTFLCEKSFELGSSSLILSSVMPSLPMCPSKAFFHFSSTVLDFWYFLLIHLRILVSLIILPICSCMLSIFFSISFNILIIVI